MPAPTMDLITTKAQFNALIQLQRNTLEQIAARHPLKKIINQICLTLQQAIPDSIAVVHLFNPQRTQLDLTCSQGASPAEQKLIRQLSNSQNGSTAFASTLTQDRPVHSADLTTEHPWTQHQPQLPLSGLCACWTWPIMSDSGRIEGRLSLYRHHHGLPDSFSNQLLEAASHLAGMAIRRTQVEDALRSTATRLHQITSTLPGVVFQYQQQSHGQRQFTFFSQQSLQVLGLNADEVLSCYGIFWSALHPEDRDAFNNSIHQSHHTNQPWHQEFRLLSSDGMIRWIQVSALPEHPENSENCTWNGIFLDISHAKASAEQMALAATAFATTSEGILITDPSDTITDVNDAFCTITGFSREELIGSSPSLIRSDQHPASFFRQQKEQLEKYGSWQGEVWNRHKNQHNCLHRLHIKLIRDERGVILHKVSVYTDIHHQHESEQRLRFLSDHDTLTQLPNRQLFNTVLEQWVRHQPALTVMMLDLDRFKHINEAMGHEAGDQLLTQVADLLRQQITPVDLLARLGGDEFALLLPMVSTFNEAQQIAQQLVSALDHPFEICGRRHFITVSVGVALAPEHGDRVDQLVRHADTALHHAKNHGRNTHCIYQPQLGQQVETWLILEPELRNALEKNQFVLFYQPLVDGASGKIIGAEALIRWLHPELGLVSPGSFLPIAEEIGLMHRLGQWVLNTACAQLGQWLLAGLDNFRLSINLAGQQIMQDGLVSQLNRLIRQHSLPAQALELEILETFVMQHEAQTAAVLQELRELGISLALDDFGTGYSSLAYLKKLPIQKVKIDQSLVRDIPQDPHGEAIARAVIALGRSLGLTVCAEGVETDAQHQFLKKEDCDQLQGYLFSRPLPANELQTLLQQQQRFTRQHSLNS